MWRNLRLIDYQNSCRWVMGIAFESSMKRIMNATFLFSPRKSSIHNEINLSIVLHELYANDSKALSCQFCHTK